MRSTFARVAGIAGIAGVCLWATVGLTTSTARAERERALPCRAKVPVDIVRVVDGDTVIVRFRDETLKIRILGLDAPELRDGRVPVRRLAEQARDRLREWVRAADNKAELRTARRRYRCYFTDAYERTLARLFVRVDGRMRDVGRKLVREGLACPRRVKRGCDPR